MVTRRLSRALFKGIIAVVVGWAAVSLAGAGTVARADDPTPQAGTLTPEEVAEYKAAHDTDPHIPLTADQQALLAKKEAMVEDWLAKKEEMVRARQNLPGGDIAGVFACADYNGDGVVLIDDILYVISSYRSTTDHAADLDGDGMVLISDVIIAVGQYRTYCSRAGITTIGKDYQGQLNDDYCGPASVSEALVIRGITDVDQTAAASLLTTNEDGTPWSGWNGDPGVPPEYNTGHPVPDVLTYVIGSPYYLPQELPWYPSSSDISTYIARLGLDIYLHWPLIADGWEVAGSENRLWGHPDWEVKHWFTISGYEDDGEKTNYMDSAFTVPGFSEVEGWNTHFPSDTLVIILGGYGYVW